MTDAKREIMTSLRAARISTIHVYKIGSLVSMTTTDTRLRKMTLHFINHNILFTENKNNNIPYWIKPRKGYFLGLNEC